MTCCCCLWKGGHRYHSSAQVMKIVIIHRRKDTVQENTCSFHSPWYYEASPLSPPRGWNEKCPVNMSCHLVTAFSWCIFEMYSFILPVSSKPAHSEQRSLHKIRGLGHVPVPCTKLKPITTGITTPSSTPLPHNVFIFNNGFQILDVWMMKTLHYKVH